MGDLKNRYGFHPARDTGVQGLHSDVRANCLKLGSWLTEVLPAGREAALAQTKLEEAMFWANAAVARNLSPLE